MRVEDAGEREGRDPDARDGDAGERREFLAAAERVDVAAEAGVVLDDTGDAERSERQPDAPRKAQQALDRQAADPADR